MSTAVSTCPLCQESGGLLLWQDDRLRIVRVQNEPSFPAFYRVIWQQHVSEMSDLSVHDQQYMMQRVIQVEQVLKTLLKPTKINLASLGNVVPHLHWHVIARFDWDSHFPSPIWAQSQRETANTPITNALALLQLQLPQVDSSIAAWAR